MTFDPDTLTTADYLAAAQEMADTGRPYLAHLLADEAASRIDDPATARRIRARHPDPTAGKD